MHSVYLVPLGRGRFELYTEPPDAAAGVDGHRRGYLRRRLQHLHERWREVVHVARQDDPARGRVARVRDWMVSRAAETIAEQRTLWSLRQIGEATLIHPSDLEEAHATATRRHLLASARRHHGLWLILDTMVLIASSVFILVPGPNVIAYYFLVRAVGHFLSWRGARQALDGTAWRMQPEPALAELGRLADLPRESRAPRVEAIASRLKLPRLAAFFDRAAVPAR